MMKRIGLLLLGLMMFGAAFGGAYYIQHWLNKRQNEQVESTTRDALEDLKEQGRVTPFVSRLMAVAKLKPEGGIPATEPLVIVPGLVRYELDLNAIRPEDVKWNSDAQRLVIRLPALTVTNPQLELDNVRKYEPDGSLAVLSSANPLLGNSGQKQLHDLLLAEAKSEVSMRFARDSARKTVERSFTIPFRAAGLGVSVKARFADEFDEDPSTEQNEDQAEGH